MRSPRLRFGPFVFDPASGVLEREGVELPLPPRVLTVLEVLLRRAGDVVSRQELIDKAWKDAFVTDTSLAEAVSVLRQALGDDPQNPSYIQTLHRRGYRFVAPVVETSPAPAAEPATTADSATVSPSIAWQLLPWSAAAICALVAAAAVWYAVTDRGDPVPPVTRFAVAPPDGTRFDARAPALALSPDAARAALSACDASGCRLYVRSADRIDPVAIPGTEDAAAPFFSPDGRSVGFFAGGHLKKVALAGGAPITLADAADALGAVWTPRGEIVFAGGGPGLRSIPAGGGDASVLTTPAVKGEIRHAWPAVDPAGELLLFTVTDTPGVHGAGRLAVLRLGVRGGPWTPLVSGGRGAFAASDVLVFSTRSELLAAAFDARRTAVTGTPQLVSSGLAHHDGIAQFAASHAGAVMTLGAEPEAERPRVFWWAGPEAPADPRGSREVDAAPGRVLDQLSLAPDGRRVAGVDPSDAARPDVWIADLERGTASRLTHGRASAAPVWSADGANVFYASSGGGEFSIDFRDAEAARPPRRLHRAAGHAIPASASPDGTRLAFLSQDPATGTDIWVVPIAGGAPEPLVRTPFEELGPSFSPDGRLLAYQSNEAGRWEIYVRRLADSRRVTVSADGGTHPFWDASGTLYFRSRGRLMRATISADGQAPGRPEACVDFPGAVPIAAVPTGRVLFQRLPAPPAGAAVVTLQWIREARRLLGPTSTEMPR